MVRVLWWWWWWWWWWWCLHMVCFIFIHKRTCLNILSSLLSGYPTSSCQMQMFTFAKVYACTRTQTFRHRHADMDTCSHVGYVQTYVQHWLPIWWASMSHFSINACKLFQKGVQIRTSWRDDIPWHTHFPFTWLRNDVFPPKKKKRSGCTWEHGTLRSGVFAVLLWCLGPSRGPGFYWKKRWELEVSIDISELAISRNLGGMVEHRLLSAIFKFKCCQRCQMGKYILHAYVRIDVASVEVVVWLFGLCGGGHMLFSYGQ